MKTCCLLIVLLCIPTLLQAQVSKTVHLTPGTLAVALTPAELGTITHLTITGTMDARDFKILHDDMPALSILDLGTVAIAGFTDTTQIEDIYYPANTIPQSEPEFGHDYITTYGLANLPGLTKITLPSSLTMIGYRAFKGCRGLTTVELPASLISIGGGAFMECTSLVSIDIPSSVSFIGKETFNGCSYLSEVNLPTALTVIKSKTFEDCTSLVEIRLPQSVAVIEYRAFYGCTQLKSPEFPPALTMIGGSAFENCSALTEIHLPSSVTTIESQAFNRCTGLTTVSLPASLNHIGYSSFSECISLTSIYVYVGQPIELGDSNDVFGFVDKNNCLLYVPKGSATAYGQAEQWKDFARIEEMPAFTLSATTVSLNAEESTVTIQITAEGSWTALSDQSWLTVDPASGTGSQTIVLSASSNDSVMQRLAKVSVTTVAPVSQDIIVSQAGVSKTIDLTAGRLATELTAAEMSGITHLTLTGEMDARDFKVIRDRMPLLVKLDIGKVNIVAYTGGEGTVHQITDYPANELPQLAFANWSQYPGKSSLSEVNLPESATSIGAFAFANCKAIKELSIPTKVTRIGGSAFADCSGLTSISLPRSITNIGDNAFRNCSSISHMDIPPFVTEIAESLFFYCTGLKSVYIPDFVTTIGGLAFYGCSSLIVISMPHMIKSIDSHAFKGCSSLKEVMIPEALTTLGSGAFANCTALTKVYAYPWMPVDLTQSPEVFAGVDKSNCTLLVPHLSRSLYEAADQWKDFLYIENMILATEDLMNPVAEINCYPNPFTSELAIAIVNPSLREVAVEIFSISGQKIRILAKAQEGQNISLRWNGKDEQGKQVPQGMYLIKMNEEVIKVVKRR